MKTDDITLVLDHTASATYPSVSLDKAHELSKLCLKDYGNGRWNHASLVMAGFIKDQFDAQRERLMDKEKVYTAISLLRSMVDGGEFHTDVSQDAIKRGLAALERL